MKAVKQRSHIPPKRSKGPSVYALKETFLRFFGDLKFFSSQPRLFILPNLLLAPFGYTLLHDPRSYQVKGGDMRKIMADIQPGDILVRGFDNYVDGSFIPGFFSHAGLYLGKVDKATLEQHWDSGFPGSTENANHYAPLDEVREKAEYGEQMVIHSMKDGIFMEDLLNFCRCDYMVAIRFPRTLTRADFVQQPYSEKAEIKKTFTGEELAIAKLLQDRKQVEFADAFPVIFKLALSQLGKEYDFGLDFSSFEKMSCTEFVYYCTKSLEWCSGVHPAVESVMGIKAPGIPPDSFVGSPNLTAQFSSASVHSKGVVEKIKARYPGPYGGFPD